MHTWEEMNTALLDEMACWVHYYFRFNDTYIWITPKALDYFECIFSVSCKADELEIYPLQTPHIY